MIDYNELENIGDEIIDIFENFTIDTLKKIAMAHGKPNSLNNTIFMSHIECPKCGRTVDEINLLNIDYNKKYVCPCGNKLKLIYYDHTGNIIVGSEDGIEMCYSEYNKQFIIDTYFENLNKIEIIYILKYVSGKNYICSLFLENKIKYVSKYNLDSFNMINPVNYITKIPDYMFKIIKTLYDPATVSGFSYEVKILVPIKEEIEEFDIVHIIDNPDLQRKNKAHIINLQDNKEYIIDSECIAKIKEPE